MLKKFKDGGGIKKAVVEINYGMQGIISFSI